MGKRYTTKDYQRLNRFQYNKKEKLSWSKRLLRWLILFALIVCGYYAYVLYKAFNDPIGSNKETVYLYITEGTTMEDLNKQIDFKIKPKHPKLLKYNARYFRLSDSLKVGRYAIDTLMTTNELVQKLLNGQQDSVNIVIGHLRTNEEIEDKLTESLLVKKDSLINYLYNDAFLKENGFNRETIRSIFLQGHHKVLWTTSPKELLDYYIQDYNDFWTKEREQKLKTLGLTKVQAVILASIVEAESAEKDEYSRIAGLYLNRYRRHLRLQSCPTLKYALKEFDLKRILNKHKEVESPYNTYKHTGFPPGPIHTPKKSTIDYVLNAEEHKYIYMCAKEDFSGKHNFAEHYADHCRNANAYQRALNKRGIR